MGVCGTSWALDSGAKVGRRNLVPLLNPKFAIELAARCARTSGSGALASPAMRGRLLLAALAAVMIACPASLPAAAQTRVDLQLVLAVDASGSVERVRFELQKQGYVAAFRHPRVLQAIRSGTTQAIAVTMVQWTGPVLQVQVCRWTRIGDEQLRARALPPRSSERRASCSAAAPRSAVSSTTP